MEVVFGSTSRWWWMGVQAKLTAFEELQGKVSSVKRARQGAAKHQSLFLVALSISEAAEVEVK